MQAPGDPAHGLVDQWMSSQVPYRRGHLASHGYRQGTMQFDMNMDCTASTSTYLCSRYWYSVQDLIEHSTVTVGTVLDCTVHTVLYMHVLYCTVHTVHACTVLHSTTWYKTCAVDLYFFAPRAFSS